MRLYPFRIRIRRAEFGAKIWEVERWWPSGAVGTSAAKTLWSAWRMRPKLRVVKPPKGAGAAYDNFDTSKLPPESKPVFQAGGSWTGEGDTVPIMRAPGEVITDPDRAEALGLTADAKRMRRERAEKPSDPSSTRHS